MENVDFTNYTAAIDDIWSGRIDGVTPDALRWHQVIQLVDLREQYDFTNAVVFLGFCCDEGVRRNQGREGAKEAPNNYRKILANLPVHYNKNVRLLDAGNIYCNDGDLEKAQAALTAAVARIIQQGGFPIVLGGGHEVTYGHYKGLRKAVGQEKIGVINIDAHLDNRSTVDGKGNSGTGFYQIAADCEQENAEFHYLALGIQEISNTKALFEHAADKEVSIIYANDIQTQHVERIKALIKAFAKQVDHLYLTIDLDAFAAPYAPGVSALAFNGIIPNPDFFAIFSTLISLPNLRTVDLAELNPKYDIDHRTARLGASLIFKTLQERAF